MTGCYPLTTLQCPMRPTDMIDQKRQGESHSQEDLAAFVQGYVSGDVPDYQVSAWLMAVCWRGMSPQETAELTQIMADSGDILDLADLSNTVDKHSRAASATRRAWCSRPS